MALNVTTFTTDCDVVSDLVEAESDTTAHYDAMIAAIKASATAVTAVYQLSEDCTRICAALGIGPKHQMVQGQSETRD